jgi:ASC-1-like (ASCH) protein
MEPGDKIRFCCGKKAEGELYREYTLILKEKKKYKSFEAMLDKEGLEKVLPLKSIKTIDEGLAVYMKPTGFFEAADEKEFGVVALHF